MTIPISPSVAPRHPPFVLHRGILLAGWCGILVFCLFFYDALLLNSLHKQVRESAISTAAMAAGNLSAKISTGVRLGKKLTTFRGLDSLVESTSATFPENTGVAVVRPDGTSVYATGDEPGPLTGGERRKRGIVVAEHGLALEVAAPIHNREGDLAGYSVVRVPTALLDQSVKKLGGEQAKEQLIIGSLAAAALLALLNLIPLADAEGVIRKKRLYALCLGSFFVVMAANAFFTVDSYRAQYAESVQTNARRVAALTGRDLNRLLLVGVSIGQLDNVEHYLRALSDRLNGAVLLEIRNAHRHRTAGSHPAGTAVAEGMGSVIPLHVGGDPDGRALWSLHVEVVREPYRDALFSTALDLLTLVVASLIFMVEMFLLFFQLLDARRRGATPRTLNHVQRSGLLRPLMFFFIMAMDMSISFIPLRMADLLTGASPLSRDVLMGLPVSAEMGTTGLSVLLAGVWMKRRGIVPPMRAGMVLMTLGYMGSMLSATPLQFILARATVGLGYGQCILAAQAYTVKDGKLADMFAGVYAGSLCGSALGAMLAERMGYSPVFMVSAVIFACLIALPALLLSEAKSESAPTPARERLSLAQARCLLGNRLFLGLVFLSLVPSALLSVGFLNYFLPVYLHSADVSQSNIGRVFMLYCLIIIYGGPWLGALVHKTPRKALMIFWGGLAGALAMLSFTVLPPFAASLSGAVLLAAATCFNVPAQSAYLLQLDIAQAIGVDQTMGLLNAMTRIGQVLGPLCAGALIATVGVDVGALWAGLAYIGINALFLALAQKSLFPARSPCV